MSGGSNNVIFSGGCRDAVAIEASFEEWCGKFCFGYFSFIIDSAVFGNKQELMDHAASARWAQTFLESRQDGQCFDVAKYPPKDVLWHLHGKHIIPPFPTGHESCCKPIEIFEDWTYGPFRQFSLSDVGDAAVIDTAAIVAVPQCDGTDRVVAYEYDTEVLGDVYIKSSELEALLLRYIKWVQSLEECAPSRDT